MIAVKICNTGERGAALTEMTVTVSLLVILALSSLSYVGGQTSSAYCSVAQHIHGGAYEQAVGASGDFGGPARQTPTTGPCGSAAAAGDSGKTGSSP